MSGTLRRCASSYARRVKPVSSWMWFWKPRPHKADTRRLRRPDQKEPVLSKRELTVDLLCRAARTFSERESKHREPSLYGVTDGKKVGTYLEHKFQEELHHRSRVTSNPNRPVPTSLPARSCMALATRCSFSSTTRRMMRRLTPPGSTSSTRSSSLPGELRTSRPPRASAGSSRTAATWTTSSPSSRSGCFR